MTVLILTILGTIGYMVAYSWLPLMMLLGCLYGYKLFTLDG